MSIGTVIVVVAAAVWLVAGLAVCRLFANDEESPEDLIERKRDGGTCRPAA